MTHSPPPGHRLIETIDGSATLFSEAFQEHCHSTEGAVAETNVHYIRGCHIPTLLKQHHKVHVLEVGFGTGLGWRETLKASEASPCLLDFYSLEFDESLIAWSCPEASKMSHAGGSFYQLKTERACLTVILGDARQTLPAWTSHLPQFDAFYQDPFSPKKNPTLWTREWFTLLGSLAAPGAYLSTYSSGIAIRKAMHEAGWGISAGEGFARKKSSTRARWGLTSDTHLIQELAQHPTPALTDGDLL